MSKLRFRFYVKILLFTFVFFLFCGFETSFWPNVIGFLPSPQLWLLMIFFIATKWDTIFAIFYIYFLGFCMARFTYMPLKMAWTSLLVVSSVLSSLKNRIQLGQMMTFAAFTLFGSVLFQVSYVCFSYWLEKNPTPFYILDRLAIVLMNFIFCYPVYSLLNYIDKAFYSDMNWSQTPERPEVDL